MQVTSIQRKDFSVEIIIIVHWAAYWATLKGFFNFYPSLGSLSKPHQLNLTSPSATGQGRMITLSCIQERSHSFLQSSTAQLDSCICSSLLLGTGRFRSHHYSSFSFNHVWDRGGGRNAAMQTVRMSSSIHRQQGTFTFRFLGWSSTN